jgi:hypothetical protein
VALRHAALSLVVLIPSIGLMTGCSRDNRPKTYPVQGRLTYAGKPMAKAVIMFFPAGVSERPLPSQATADAEGRYQLSTFLTNDGAPAGEYVVTLTWPLPKREKRSDPEGDSDSSDLLNNVYSDSRNTKLRATVDQRDNEINFHLP